MNPRDEIEQSLSSRAVPEGFPASVVLPDYLGYSIASVPSVVCRALGVHGVEPPRLESIPIPTADRVVLLIVDGLGYRRLVRLCSEEDLPSLRALTKENLFFPITSVFPSTTVAALTTLTTGMPPVSHGIIGYRLYLREVGAITNMIRFSLVGSNHDGSAVDAGLDVDHLLPGRTFYERLGDRRIATDVLLPRAIARSGLSKVLYRGCSRVHPTSSIGDMFVATRQILREADGPSLLTLYWPGLDAVAHARGPDSDAYLAEARVIDTAIGRELLGRLERTLLVITSDHGFVGMRPEDYIPLEDLDGLGEAALLPPVGEPRASYLFLRHAANPVGLSSLDAPGLLRGGILRLTADQVLESGLLGAGDLHPEIRRRLGDLVLASTGSAGVVHPYPDAATLRGMHGGLSAEEMLVPLVVVSL